MEMQIAYPDAPIQKLFQGKTIQDRNIRKLHCQSVPSDRAGTPLFLSIPFNLKILTFRQFYNLKMNGERPRKEDIAHCSTVTRHYLSLWDQLILREIVL